MAIPGFKEPKLPAHLRAFDDTTKTRQLIYDGIVGSLEKSFPVSDGKHRLELTDLHYSGSQSFSQEAQKKAIMSNRNLNTPLTGTWRVIDEETGGEIDKREDVVMHVPYYTKRGTVINRGNEYAVINQARLKPGIYTRTKQSGEHEAHFNVKPGTGKTFRIWMEPATGIFRVNVGQANIPAYPFLKILGVSDSAMQKAWGPDVYDANVAKHDNQALAKLYKRFAGQRFDPDAEQADQEAYLREGIMTSGVDPQVIARTMGVENTASLSPRLLLRTTQKLLNISRGEEQEDDREAPQFSDYYSIEDFMKERIEKDAGRTARNLLFKIRRDKSLKRVGRGALNPYIKSLMLGSGLAQNLEETNPLQILDQQTRVIKLGEGGISGGVEAVIDEARDVNPGQAGFIDLAAGPESEKVGIDLRTSYRTYKGKDKQLYAEFTDRSGKPVYLNPLEASKTTLGFPGQDPKATMAHVLQEGKAAYVPTADVDYWIPSSEHMYAAALNLTPMMTGYMPSRAFYSAKYWSQFLPLVKGEVPLVQSQVPGTDRSFSEYYGRKVAALNSDVNGVVSRVTNKGISILDEDGKKHFVETIKNFPYNRMSAISYTPTVKSGDVIRAGDLLASSNFTDDTGTLALGSNLKTAVVPARGYSFEDALVISESAAKKMASERLYAIDKEARRGVEISRKRFISAFPGKFDRAQVETVDDRGVVKPGTVLSKGDPVVLAVGPKLLSTADAQLGKLHKALRNAFRDESIVWEYSSPGEVVDVGRTTTGVKVNIKSASPVQVGDKLTNMEASKGIVSKILPDDEMPRDGKTGDPYELLLNPMVVLSRVAPNQLVELQLAKIAKQTGKPYILPSDPPPEGWVEFARSELAKHGIPDKREVYDPVTGQMIKPLGEGHMFMSVFHHLAEKKLSGRDVGGYSFEEQPARGGKRGSKRLSLMDTTALLAHGAHEVLKDALLVRGTKNEDYWNALRLGRPLPEPTIPFIYNKLMATLKAGGINVVKQGDIISIMPMTNKDVEGVSSGEIKSSAQINARNFEPVPGGLFDQKLTGGMQGCFHPSTVIWTEHGGLTIGYIVKNRLSVRVRSYDFASGQFSLRRVTNWFCNQAQDGIGVSRSKCQHARLAASMPRYSSTVLWGTPTHQVYERSGNKRDLESADYLLAAVENLNEDQFQVLVGGLLGDSHIAPAGHLDVTHGQKQKEYMLAKARIFGRLSRVAPDRIDNSGGVVRPRIKCNFRTRNHDIFAKARARWYADGVKHVCREDVEQLNWFGLAVWFCDDGTVSQPRSGNKLRLTLCTHSFCRDDVEFLQKFLLRRFGLKCRIDRDKKKYNGKPYGWMLGFASVASRKLLSGVAPYLVPCMQYKVDVCRHTRQCRFCGAAINPTFKICSHCMIHVVVADAADGKISKTARHRFGNSRICRDMLAGLEPIPDDAADQFAVWRRSLNTGSCTRVFDNNTYQYRLMEVESCFEKGFGYEYEKTKTVYDIEVEGAHNYFANGFLVSNSRWTHVKLTEPMPNPVMEEAIRRLLDLRVADYLAIVSGRKELDGLTGGRALERALRKIDIPTKITELTTTAKTARGARRDNAIKSLRYLTGAQKQKINPGDWIIDKVPVIPPVFRPVSMIGDIVRASDLNGLYRDLIETNNSIGTLQADLPPEALADEKAQLYKSLVAAFGLGEAITPEGQSKRWHGAIRQVIGTSPKRGLLQSKVLSKSVDVVARGVAAPDPNLDMDSIGIPADMGWELYRPFVTRRLVRRGFPPSRAAELIEKRAPEARDELDREMALRPVIMDRAPTWHKFNLLAFEPHLVDEDVVRTNPLIVAGFNLDYDGDSVNFHVPVTNKAVEQAREKMLPSKNLFRVTDLRSVMHAPSKEMVMGLYQLTRKSSKAKTPMIFATTAQAKKAYKQGLIDVDDPIIIQKA